MNPPVISALEPTLPVEGDGELADLAVDLVHKSASLAGSLTESVRLELGRLVRSMNCYYSNFIEGHQTTPRDIERALARDFSEGRQRDLQSEAVAHITLQKQIDEREDPRSLWPASDQYVRWLHKSFCDRLPESMLWVQSETSDRKIRVIPGELRVDHVRVGRHEPPAPATLPDYMIRFDQAYDAARLPKIQQIISAAAAHHRLLWIHPFIDGNGRVARLMSHSMLLRIGVGSTLWSASRGLARNVARYKSALADADSPRQGDLDGRGALSLSALREFCRFFLDTCIDQVEFMRQLLQPAEILRRIELYTNDEVAARRLLKGSFELLREAFYQGEVPRGKAPEITGYEERRARETLSVLLERGLLKSSGPRSSVSLGFPMAVLDRWLPTLYPIEAPPLP